MFYFQQENHIPQSVGNIIKGRYSITAAIQAPTPLGLWLSTNTASKSSNTVSIFWP